MKTRIALIFTALAILGVSLAVFSRTSSVKAGDWEDDYDSSITNLSDLSCGSQEITFSGTSDFPGDDNSGTNREQFRLRVTLDGNEIYLQDNDGNWTAPAQTVNAGNHTVVSAVQHRTSSNSGVNWSAWSNVLFSGDTDEFSISVCPVPGCMDEVASNYNPEANEDDKSCVYDEVPFCIEGETVYFPVNQLPEYGDRGECTPPEPEHKDNWQFGGAPQCTDSTPLVLPSNVHVVRNGSDATVNFFTQSSNANIYYRTSGQSEWQHALRDIPVTGGYVSVTIHDLNPTGDYDFGVQSANSCAGGEVVVSVVVDDWSPRTFMFTHYEWLK